MKKILRSTLAIAIAASLAACHNSNSDPVADITPSTLEFQGTIIKGALEDAIIKVYAAQDTEFLNPLPLAEDVRTGPTGGYSATITAENGEPITGAFVVRATTDEKTTMTCDATNCGGNAQRGDKVAADELTNLTLTTFTFSDGANKTEVNVNTLTTMATDAIQAATTSNTNTGIDLSTINAEQAITLQKDASEVVGALFKIDLKNTNLYDIKIVDASDSAAVSAAADDNTTKLTFINASLASLKFDADSEGTKTLGDAINNYVKAVKVVTKELITAADPKAVDLQTVAAEALLVIDDTMAQVIDQVETLKTDINFDLAAEDKIVAEITLPTTIPDDIASIVGDIIFGTGGTGGTGGTSGTE